MRMTSLLAFHVQCYEELLSYRYRIESLPPIPPKPVNRAIERGALFKIARSCKKVLNEQVQGHLCWNRKSQSTHREGPSFQSMSGGAVISCPYCSSSPSVRLFGPLVEEIRSHPFKATEWNGPTINSAGSPGQAGALFCYVSDIPQNHLVGIRLETLGEYHPLYVIEGS